MSSEITFFLICATIIIYIFMEIKYAGKGKLNGFDSTLVVLMFVACLFAMYFSIPVTPDGINTQWQNVGSYRADD